jgi:hypothetical protein
VFDAPAADVEVPIGAYARQLVLLQRRGSTNFAVGLGTNRLAVTATNPIFATGGCMVAQVPENQGWLGKGL